MRADTTSKVYSLKALNLETHISLACAIIGRHFKMLKMYPYTDCCQVAGDVVHQRHNHRAIGFGWHGIYMKAT